MNTCIDICNHVQDLHLERVTCSYLLQPPGMQDGTPSCNADSLMTTTMIMIPESAAYVGKDTIYIMDISGLWA